MPELTLEHVLRGEHSIEEVLLETAGISIVPGASGITDFVNLETTRQQRLIAALKSIEKDFDYLLVDTSAGIHANVLSFIESAHQCLLVITQEPTSLTDAFSLLRVMQKKGINKKINIVVNCTETELSGRKVFKRFSAAVKKYIGYHVAYLGFIQKDEALVESVCQQRPVLLQNPQAASSQCFMKVAETLNKLNELSDETEQLSDLLSKHVIEEMPDFSAKDIVKNLPHRSKALSLLAKRQMLIDHKDALLDYIDDPEKPKQEKAKIIGDLIDAYFKQNDEFPPQVLQQLNQALKHKRVSQKQLDELLSNLEYNYQDLIFKDDKENASQQLKDLLNGFVEQHGDYPFDPVYALYQSLDLGLIDDEQLTNLLLTLNLFYQSRNKTNINETSFATTKQEYCVDHNQERLDQLSVVLQQKYLRDIEQNMSDVVLDDEIKMVSEVDHFRELN